MRRLLCGMLLLALALSSAGCTYIGGRTNLTAVATRAQLTNVTTGDGTFENYTATGHYTGTEVGIAVGIPFMLKFFEVFPINSNEALLTDVARSAQIDGATAMINVTPHKEIYTGIPFFFAGIYIDTAEGTGIR